jgi:hypothetical protein
MLPMLRKSNPFMLCSSAARRSSQSQAAGRLSQRSQKAERYELSDVCPGAGQTLDLVAVADRLRKQKWLQDSWSMSQQAAEMVCRPSVLCLVVVAE